MDTVKRILRWMLGLVLLAGLIYAGDYVSLRYPIPRGRQQFGSVTVQPYYLIHEKNGKTEYQYNDPQQLTCVNSLFPHFGYPTCWYLTRHPEKKTEI